jgi:tungstate transport system ATP-binding protein
MIYAITQLKKNYGPRTVLDIPRFEIEREGIYALLGPNGAGKTTFLNILGFIEPPSSGQITFRSQAVQFSEPELQRLRKDVVILDQQPILFTTTVYKNLEFGLKIRGIPTKQRRRIIDETLELVGMQDFAQAQAHRLSGGETQRVAIARALVLSPTVFLCDEPTSSVDVENQSIISNILRQVAQTKKITILFTTHDRLLASSLANHTLVLNHGKMVPTVYENIFSARLDQIESGTRQCVIGNIVRLTVKQDRLKDKKKQVRLFINPEEITIGSIAEDNKLLNNLQGRVVQISAENGRIRVVIDDGILIAILMPPEKYNQSRPMVGESINVSIPPEAVSIF